MKITTLNLQGFDDWETRTNTIASYLKRKKSDIVFFQEVVFLPEVNARNQVQLLNNDLRYPYQQTVISRLQVGLEYPVYREGLGCLSRYPIVSSDTIVLQQASGDEHQRIVQLIDVSVNGEIIKFANVHFSITDFTDFATAHLEETLATLKARGEKRIIVGDFNLNHLEESIDIWGEDYSASTDFTYVSYPSMEKRNDYFLIPKQFSFEAFEVSDEENMSDHNALTATVAVPAFQQQAKLASLVAAYKE
ncbi:MAG: endonuclease/exonuclease/phosphatase family protein [Candidatus Saccharimonadales bacterium]|jgi:endonuclease/exonuclease/phosphatase family metal-dependent hydrolase